MRIYLALLALFVSVPAVADQKLVADCTDDATQLNYRVYQDLSDASGLKFTAENTRAGWSAPVELINIARDQVLWATDIRAEHQFLLAVNLKDTTDEGSDAILATEGFQGHLRCKISF